MKIFHAIKRFFAPRSPEFAATGNVNQHGCSGGNVFIEHSVKEYLSWQRGLLRWLAAAAAGCFAATAFPPLNWSIAAFCSLTVLFLLARNLSAVKAALAGWLWGMGYALCSFFWLREINVVIPWLMMIVLGAYYIPMGWMAALANRYILLPPPVRAAGFSAQKSCRDFPLWRQLAWCLVMAGTLVIVEFLRSNVLPWNYLGVAFYKNTVFMQLVRITGVSGLSFLAALVNGALALAILTVVRQDPESGARKYRRPLPLLFAVVLLALVMAYGISSLQARRKEYKQFKHQVRLTMVQGNLHSGRYGGISAAERALKVYTDLTRTQIGIPTDVVIWPETAVAYPLRGRGDLGRLYRATVRTLSHEMNAPMLLGTLEFDESTVPPGSLNSAVLTDTRDILYYGYKAIYSKVHPVPFGEFVPMRRYLPDWVIKIIDMQRDLTPGKSMDPIALNENIRLGISICFEDVFAYISRAEAGRRANLLLVIADDAWYPTSSEPEQHLANSIARAIENNLPMVRCGNDSATCLISPGGEIIWSLAEAVKLGDGKAHRRGAGAATITVSVPSPEQQKQTFYSRFGEWVAALSAMIVVLALGSMLLSRLEFFRKLKK